MTVAYISDYLDKPLCSAEEAARRYLRWSNTAAMAAELAARSRQQHVALDYLGRAKMYRAKAAALLDMDDSEFNTQFDEIAKIYAEATNV
jgi:hypothetical protein